MGNVITSKYNECVPYTVVKAKMKRSLSGTDDRAEEEDEDTRDPEGPAERLTAVASVGLQAVELPEETEKDSDLLCVHCHSVLFKVRTLSLTLRRQ